MTAHLGRRGLLPPICTQVDEWAEAHTGTESRILFAPRQITRTPPRTVEPSVHERYTSRVVHNMNGRYLVPIQGARLIGQNGLVVLPDGQLAAESVFNRSVLEADVEYRSRKKRPIVAMPGDYFSLVVIWSANSPNYYHWIHDTVLRIYGVIEHLPPHTKYIVPAAMTPRQREILHAAGIEDEQIILFSGDAVWELETLHFAPCTETSGNDHPEADRWLRDKIFDTYGIRPSTADRRIFLSRRGQRRLVNEDEVGQFLQSHGFEICDTDALSFRDQADLFAQTEILVATHGAGLTNMLFAPAGLKVVDIIEPWLVPKAHVFWSMAEALDHEYWYFISESVPRRGRQDDPLVPLGKLVATIEQIERGIGA